MVSRDKSVVRPGRRSVIRWFRRTLKPFLGEYKYVILFIATMLIAFIGFLGFSILYPEESFLNKVYLTLQLFTLSSGRYAGPPIIYLDIARILAPIIIYLSLITVVADRFYYHLELFWLKHFTRDHIVVCGLGYVGSMVVRNPRVADESAVVVIEKDPSNEELEWCRKRGFVVIAGDATEKQTLKQANIKRARAVFVATGDDDANANVIVQVNGAIGDRQEKLSCFVHIENPEYTDHLQAAQMSLSTNDPLLLEFFNMYHVLSNCAVDSIPRSAPIGVSIPSDDQVVVVGLGRMGESIIVQVAKRWRGRGPGDKERRISVVVVDKDALRKKELLEARYPGLDEHCEITPYGLDLFSPEFCRWSLLQHIDADRLKAVFLCLTDESLNFSVGLRFNQELRDLKVPIVIRTVTSNGFAHFFKEICAQRDDCLQNIRAFPLISCSCCVDTLIGINEILARALHNDYLMHRKREGTLTDSDPALRPWKELDAEYKAANRAQAANIVSALKNIGYSVVHRVDWDQPPITFTGDEVEKLAEMEHVRWMDDRKRRRWTPGPRDLEKKTSPYLVLWKDLEERIREYDRVFVRDYPAILAKVDLALIKRPDAPE